MSLGRFVCRLLGHRWVIVPRKNMVRLYRCSRCGLEEI